MTEEKHPPDSIFRPIMRVMFRFRGTRTLAHLMMRTMKRSGVVWIDDFDGDLKFRCRLHEHMGRQIYWRGMYSWRQLQLLDRLLRPHMVFFDVGANQGEFTLFAAKRLSQGSIFAFEPMSEMFDRLCENILANDFSNVQAEQVGLWSEETQRDLFTSGKEFRDGTHHDGLGTIFQTPDRAEKVETIRLQTLDGFVETRGVDKLDIMKIDVEGSELGVLQGGERTLEAHRPVLLLEADPGNAEAAGSSLNELFGFLDRWYTFETVLSTGKTRPVIPENVRKHADILCSPR